nr:ATP-binding protein [uncultured Merdimonas sp.]
MESVIIIAGIAVVTMAAAGLIYFRRKYFLLYQKVQNLQKTILEGGLIESETDREGPEDVVRDGFLKIQKKYEIEAEALRKDRQMVQELISDLSHQLKTPLANIRLYQELLKKPHLEKEQQRDMQRRLEEQTDKLDWLLAVLFQMAQLERGVASLTVEKAFIFPAIKRAVETVLPKAEKKEISFWMEESLDEKAADTKFYYDSRWTEEVFVNILENGVKYSPKGSVIRLSVEYFETYGAVRIEDEGSGIAREEQSQIFRKFYRGRGTGNIEGWGIGLYLSRLILDQENGYVTVESEEGKGSIFRVFLPISREKESMF